jgi:hypothetical protein
MRLCVASVATLSQDAGAPFRALEYVQALQVITRCSSEKRTRYSPHTGMLQHALTAGSGSVDLKEYEKKNTILQQCREKIESVCFDLRLRKVRRGVVLRPPRHDLPQLLQQLLCFARDQ